MEPDSTPPAVPSDSVGCDCKSVIWPFLIDSCITQEFIGETPNMLISLFKDFKYPPTPEIRPPPPTLINIASIISKSWSISYPTVPWPKITSMSL